MSASVSEGQNAKREKLAAKLRENLKRRKQQARARRSGESVDEDGAPSGSPESSAKPENL